MFLFVGGFNTGFPFFWDVVLCHGVTLIYCGVGHVTGGSK